MNRLHISKNPFDSNDWVIIETDDILLQITKEFEYFPESAKIYHKHVSESTEVTPKCEQDIGRIKNLDGDFFLIVYPELDPFTIAAIVVSVISAALSVFTYLNMPKPKNSAPTSSNNELASRQNSARLNGRIPDIFGKLRATPDLISVPYTTFNADGREVENCLMVIGRGYHQIHDCRESETDVEGISGTSVSIYDPFTSITGEPIYKTGRTFSELPKSVKKSSAVNGQTLQTPNDKAIDSNSIYFEYPNLIKSRDSIDFSQYFSGGESIEIVGATFGALDIQLSGEATATSDKKLKIESAIDIPDFSSYKGIRLTGALVEVNDAGVEVYKDLSGQYDVDVTTRSVIAGGFLYEFSLANAEITNPNWSFVVSDELMNAGYQLNQNASSISLDDIYSISSIGADNITLSNAETVNPDWSKLQSLPNQNTSSQSSDITLNKVSNKWVGWNSIAMIDATELILNVYFVNGLFRQDSKGGTSYAYLTIEIEYQQIDENNTPIGQVYKVERYFENSRRDAYGVTINVPLQFTGSLRFRVCKTKVRQIPNVQADVKLKDAFLSAESNVLNYGNVTVVRTETIGTDGALSVKERKLNCLVTRKLKADGAGSLVATTSAAQAIINMALDPYIGRRTVNEVNIEQINAEILKAQNYFASSLPTEFCYTFDDDSMSFEEQAGIIASAVFCEAYRFGSKLQLSFESPQENSVLLFNHRNKIPMKETMTRNLGNQKEYDGVEIEYTSPIDDARIKYFVGSNSGSTNPLKINSSGIRNAMQAKIRAHREWNKLQYHRLSCEFTATDESNILARNDRILVASDNENKIQTGEILIQNGLIVVTSQPVFIDSSSHYMHLQMSSGVIDSILCTQGMNEYEVILSRPPIEPLITDDDMKVKTVYSVVSSTSKKSTVFLVSTIEKSDENSNTIKAINYSEKYYKDDLSFI